MEIKRILCIGGHGDLGRPVVRRLHSSGFQIRLLVRNPSKVEELFPFEFEIVKGDLKDPESIKAATEGVDAVYLNLATKNTKSTFKEELDGTKNILYALRGRLDVVVCKLSSFGAAPDRSNRDQDQKWQAEQDIINSGHPYIIFKPSWFMESLPMFTNKGKFSLFGKGNNKMCWLAGDDYGRQVAKAFSDKKFWNKKWPTQGALVLSMHEAAKTYIDSLDEPVKISSVPLIMLKVIGLFNKSIDDFYQLMKMTDQMIEEPICDETWKELGKPELDIADYVRYCKQYNDWPSKQK